MAWTSGTVTGHLNLLSALKTFLTTDATLVAASQNWAVEKDETIASYAMTSPTVNSPTGGFGATWRDIYFTGPGLASADAIHVNIRAYTAPSIGLYNWMIQGATAYESAAAWHQQPNNSWDSNEFKYLTLTNSTIDYWFVATGRWFIVICKISGDFYASINGFLLPYALPSEYPYPLFVSGVSDSISDLPTSTSLTNPWVTQGQTSGRLRHRDGAWLNTNYTTSISTSTVGVWPWYPVKAATSSYQLIGSLDGSFPILPMTLFSGYDGGNVYGEIEYVYYVPGLSPVANPLSEDTLTIGSDTYLIVQNVDKTDRHAYAAIKLA